MPRVVAGCLLLVLGLLGAPPMHAEEAPAKAPATRKAPPKSSTTQLLTMIEEQRALIDEQHRLLAEQAARIAAQEARIEEDAAAAAVREARLAELEVRLAELTRQLEAVAAEIPAIQEQQALAERLEKVEAEMQKPPELPEGVVSAGYFPGSIRIPGTDSAIKFGGRIRTAAVVTLDPLGSDDRFITNSIPVEPDDAAAGTGKRTTFSANTSRFNIEVRTPSGAGYMRVFLEGDFFGESGSGSRTSFRLRHAFAEFRGILFGQTWSTFSDPAADHEDLDFEGINGENVIRQPQFRYTWPAGERVALAVAAEAPEVSLTGGQGVNLVPDLVGRAVWKVRDIGHLQASAVLRQIKGEWELDPTVRGSEFAWGASVSGVVPFHFFDLTDRLIFQINVGKGNARYVNDLNSLGGQDAVFDDATGRLEPLRVTGGYIDFEHQWKRWETTRVMKLRSSVIWSYVEVDNLTFQPDDAYHRTNRWSANLVFSPIERINFGIEYVYGTRTNKNGNRGKSSQVQVVGIFRF